MIHRGLLFSSGLLAGLVMLQTRSLFPETPFLPDWAAGCPLVDVVSLAGLACIILLLIRKALR